MSDTVLVALISLIGVLTSVLVSSIVARGVAANELLKIQAKFSDKLLDKRLSLYEELWEQVDRIYTMRKKFKGAAVIDARNKECLQNLRLWKRKHGILFSSEDSLKTFYSLESALAANPGNGNSGYTDEQLEKIETARNQFRKSLMDDLGILHSSTKNAKNKLK